MPAFLFAALALGQTIFAPADVPKNHWAFSAVNEMVEEGLLKGYPSQHPSTLKLLPINLDRA
ncbi:hypothetical protein BH11ARM2_BH11ARM2_31690 [soil metagenome]